MTSNAVCRGSTFDSTLIFQSGEVGFGGALTDAPAPLDLDGGPLLAVLRRWRWALAFEARSGPESRSWLNYTPSPLCSALFGSPPTSCVKFSHEGSFSD